MKYLSVGCLAVIGVLLSCQGLAAKPQRRQRMDRWLRHGQRNSYPLLADWW